MERRGELARPCAPSGKRGCLKEVQIQALADQQVRQSSLQTHQGFLPSSQAGETQATDFLAWSEVMRNQGEG